MSHWIMENTIAKLNLSVISFFVSHCSETRVTEKERKNNKLSACFFPELPSLIHPMTFIISLTLTCRALCKMLLHFPRKACLVMLFHGLRNVCRNHSRPLQFTRCLAKSRRILHQLSVLLKNSS